MHKSEFAIKPVISGKGTSNLGKTMKMNPYTVTDYILGLLYSDNIYKDLVCLILPLVWHSSDRGHIKFPYTS